MTTPILADARRWALTAHHRRSGETTAQWFERASSWEPLYYVANTRLVASLRRSARRAAKLNAEHVRREWCAEFEREMARLQERRVAS